MYHCNPVCGERFYLRLLLTRVRGPQSPEDLYIVEGVTYPSYRGACITRGLAEDDREWVRCFQEAKDFTTGSGLRTLFLIGLRQKSIADPLGIWNQFKEHFCDDLQRTLTRRSIRYPADLSEPHLDYGLYLLELGLEDQLLTLAIIGLPSCNYDWSSAVGIANCEFDPIEEASLGDDLQSKLNADQKSCFDTIVAAIANDPQTAHFYLQGPGGTGKTFLYKTLCHYY
jgi:PIF1-like helicase